MTINHLSERQNHVIIVPSMKNKGGAIVTSRYDSMSKEELVAAMKAKNKSYKWQKACVLTPAEGEKLETEILPLYGCTNVSQLVKKIVNNELTLFQSESN